MPELRLVVLALQDRLAYGPTFESAMAALFGGQASTLGAPVGTAPTPRAQTETAAQGQSPQAQAAARRPAPAGAPEATSDLNALIADAARNLSEYQRLTAEGKLGEAGQRLEALKRTLEELQKRRR
jgi:uncharacterized membrane protein (UPF0182 family)